MFSRAVSAAGATASIVAVQFASQSSRRSPPTPVRADDQAKLAPSLMAVGPLDGRYARNTQSLVDYFSECAFIRYRARVEIEYFLALRQVLPEMKSLKLTTEQERQVRGIWMDFTPKDAQWVKDKERITNHDVKAIEYFVKDRLDKLGLEKYREFVHFGLTSEDINSTASPLSLREFVQNVYRPLIKECVLEPLRDMAHQFRDVPMLSRTHGQAATPTRVGKEIYIFVERIERQLDLLDKIPFSGKFGGATGGFNAQLVAYPQVDWIDFANRMYKDQFGLERQQCTHQLEHYDDTGAIFDTAKRINTILIDLSRDMWQYISVDYFKLKVVANEVGSSAMPHKVNPIDFENAEGNFGIANSVFEHLSAKLPISRQQRDLSDSTVRRNFGVPFGHTVVALRSLQRGISKLALNEKALDKALEENWAVTAEAIQTILRRDGYDQPYEALKAATRGKDINATTMREFVDGLQGVSEETRRELRQVSPQTFIGLFEPERFDRIREANRKTH